MTKIFQVMLLWLLILLNSCNGQDKQNSNIKFANKKMVERFDNDLYEKTNYGFNQFTKQDGSVVFMIDFDTLSGGVIKEIPPKPSFKTIYKEFYANGYIKKKETYIGENTKVDTSEYYNEDGNIKQVDENKKFGKIKPEDVLKFLDSKKIINISNGSGRFNKDERPAFQIEFDENKKVFIITIFAGKPNTGPWDDIGEPPAFLQVYYKMDGKTGKVEEIK